MNQVLPRPISTLRLSATVLPALAAAALAALAATPADAGRMQAQGQRSGVYRYVVLWQGGGQQWRGGGPGGWRPAMRGGRGWNRRYGWNQPGQGWPGQGWPGHGGGWTEGPWKPGPGHGGPGWPPVPGHPGHGPGPGGPGHAGPGGHGPGPGGPGGPRPLGGGLGIGWAGGPGTIPQAPAGGPRRTPLGVCGFGGACPGYGPR
jgi:hypothetical protein